MKTKRWVRVGVIVAACVVALTFAADEKQPDPAAGDEAWRELLKSFRPPPQPAEWRTNEPTKEQIAAYEKNNGVLAAEAADKSKEFYTKFPSHARAVEAKIMEIKLLSVAVQLGVTNRQAAFEALEEKRLNDPTLPADEKYNLGGRRLMRLLTDESTNRGPALAKAEKIGRDLREEFPKREESNDLLLMVAEGFTEINNIEKARAILEDVASKASGETKETAEVNLRKLNRLGKPLELAFTDLNGKEQDIKNHAGKVVLIDFWATWCPPCRAALPDLKELYKKHRSSGFEIVGISLDNDKELLDKVIAEEGIPWPQYYDSLGRENKVASKLEVSGLPTAWLVDRKGNLRELNALQSLPAKIEKLLAEKQ